MGKREILVHVDIDTDQTLTYINNINIPERHFDSLPRFLKKKKKKDILKGKMNKL